MVWHRQGLPRGVERMAEADVAAALANDVIAKALKGSNGFLPRDDRELRTHWVTTTLPMSTPEGSGIASP